LGTDKVNKQKENFDVSCQSDIIVLLNIMEKMEWFENYSLNNNSLQKATKIRNQLVKKLLNLVLIKNEEIENVKKYSLSEGVIYKWLFLLI
jgi:hypothetical protein